MDIYSTSNSSLNSWDVFCSFLGPRRFMFVALLVFYILLAPLFGFFLYIGCSKWSKQRSGSSKVNFANADVVTLNMAAVESMNIFGICLMLLPMNIRAHTWWVIAGHFLYLNASYLQSSFHCLVCLERYMAVVHPVPYLRLKNKKGVANVAIVFVWIFSSGGTTLGIFSAELLKIIIAILHNVLSLIIIFYCSISVLSALMRPAPGDRGADRKRVDPSKRAAFDTVVTILGALLLRFVPVLVFYMSTVLQLSKAELCAVTTLAVWCKMPSSLVLPLLFLRKAGKLPRCKCL